MRMFNQWSMNYDRRNGVWIRKVISCDGIEYHYIHNNTVIITKSPSEIAKEWARDPRPLIERIEKQIDNVLAATIDAIRRTMIITYKKGDKTYTVYHVPHSYTAEIPDEKPIMGIPCPAGKGFKELPNSAHTYVKKGKGHLIVRQCIPGQKILALWRPGTIIFSTSPIQSEPEMPKWEWVFSNGKRWIQEEDTIRLDTPLPYIQPPDGVEPAFSIKTPLFSVYHDHTGVDWVVTSRTVEKIETRAKNVKKLFWKIFTGDYRIL